AHLPRDHAHRALELPGYPQRGCLAGARHSLCDPRQGSFCSLHEFLQTSSPADALTRGTGRAFAQSLLTQPMHPRAARTIGLWVLTSLVLIAGCRDEQAGPKNRAAPPQASGGNLLESAPQLTFQSGGTWEQGAITYLGSRAPPTVKPGTRIVLAHYFL